MEKKAIAIIPARKNSKGIKFKNKRKLLGKPLISYTIEAAIESKIVDIIVASDDEDILDIAKTYGIYNDYIRPENVSNDEASMDSLILDVLKYLKKKNYNHKYAITLQPTSPFRTSKDIINAIELVENSNKKTVIGVSRMMHHPYECIEESVLLKETSWKFIAKPQENKKRRQEYEDKYWFINGAIYCYSIDDFLELKGFNWDNSVIYKMDIENSIDIDTEFEFEIAESLMRKIINQ
jgi:CMP-N,N'-diacetyllegionaminic acid synthase